MNNIKLSVDIWEVNRYDFTVEVDKNLPEEKQEEQAKSKLKEFLITNAPDPHQYKSFNDIQCHDRTSEMYHDWYNSKEIIFN